MVREHLREALQLGTRGKLHRDGLVTAARCSGGGYRFSGNVKRVTLLDGHLALGASQPARRTTGSGRRDGNSSARDRVFAEIDETTETTFGSITLETLLKLVRRM